MGCFEEACAESEVMDLAPFSGDQGEWTKFNYDSGAAVTALPRAFAPKEGT